MLLRISSQPFVSFSLELSHSLFSLILLHTQSILGALQHQRNEVKGRTRNQREARIKQGRLGSSGCNDITCRYRVSFMFSLLDLACMVHACVYFVLLLSLTWVLLGVAMDFSLALPFLDSHGVMGSSYLVELDFRMVLKLGGVVSRKQPQGLGIP